MGIIAEPVIAGTARAPALINTTPLSFWGGVDPNDGRIIDPASPHHGTSIGGRALFLAATRGSSSSSSVLLELLRRGLGPAAIILSEVDAILAVGVIVGRELDYAIPPVLRLPVALHGAFADGQMIEIAESGAIA